MKKLSEFLTVCLCAFIALSAAACGGVNAGPGGTNVDKTKKVGGKISVWTVAPLIYNYKQQLQYYPDDKQALFTKAVIEGFENKYAEEGVEVELIHSDWGVALNQSLMTGITGNTLPDIVAGEMFVRSYVMNNHFQSLDFSQNYDILPQAEAVGKCNDKWYALPVWTGTLSLCVNKNVLREAGVIESNSDAASAQFKSAISAAPYNRSAEVNPIAPATWEDMLAICKYIKNYYAGKNINAKGGALISNTAEGSAWRALGYMRTAGGEMADSDDNVKLYDDQYKDANVKAMSMIRELAATAPANSLTLVNEELVWAQFFQNRAAYIVEGIDAITRASREDYASYRTPGDIVASELPTYESDGKKSNVLIGTVYYSITNNTKNYNTALAFLEYLLSEDVQFMAMEYDMRLPTRKDLLGSNKIEFMDNYDTLKSFLAPVQKSEYSFSGGIPSFFKRNTNVGQIWETWNSAFNSVVSGTDSIAAILQNAHNRIAGLQS